MTGAMTGRGASRRLLRFLAEGAARVVPFAGAPEGCVMLERADGKRMLADPAGALREGVARRDGETFALTPEGRAHLARLAGGTAAQHRVAVARRIGGETLLANAAESPLARLRFRSDREGRTWLDDATFEAGERLRRDFTLGALEQKVTASWDPTASVRGGGGGRGGKTDLTDGAIDARARMEGALATLGPELAGVAMDVCCFLKGLERVERERRWPPRSAKLMLRAALGLLARHYGTAAGEGARRNRRTRHWGVESYRPTGT